MATELSWRKQTEYLVYSYIREYAARWKQIPVDVNDICMSFHGINMLIKKLDKGLKTYYEAFNRNDYINSDKIGKFTVFACENEFTDEDIEAELYGEEDDYYTVTEFDVDDNGQSMFPLNPPIKDEIARNQEIVRILKIIAEEGQYKPTSTTAATQMIATEELLEMTANVSVTDMDKAVARYRQQMLSFSRNIEKNEDLKYFFGVSEKWKIPFLTYMVDMYANDKATYFSRNAYKIMTVKHWSLQSGYMNKLRTRYPGITDKLQSAIGYVYHGPKMISHLHFSPTVKIKDNLKAICKYITSVPLLIKEIMKNPLVAPPFQVELLIAVKGVISNVNVGDDNDEDDENMNNPNTDYIGHVQRKLAKYPVIYFPQNNWDINDETEQSIHSISRSLNQRYSGFRTVLTEYHKNKDNDDDDEEKDSNYNGRIFNAATYPQNMRFDIFVDRRENKRTNKENMDHGNRDQMALYQPPDFCNFISNDHVPEIGFELVEKCIIPSKKEHITSLDSICGQLMTFMFNVEAKDEIKCYIVWNGQTMRFHGEHMFQVLPHLFVQNNENIKFVNDKQEINTMITNFNVGTPDTKFHQFQKNMLQHDV